MTEYSTGKFDCIRKFVDEYAVYIETEGFKDGWDRSYVSEYNIINKDRVKQLTDNYNNIEVIYSQTKHFYKIENSFGKGLLDSNLKELLPIAYSDIDVDKNSDIIRARKGRSYSDNSVIEYIDSNGKLLRSIFYNGHLYSDGAYGPYKGDLSYEFPLYFMGYCIVTCKGYKGILDVDGRYVIPPIYEKLKIIDCKKVIACLNSKYGLINFSETVLLDFLYDRLEYCENDFFIVRKNNCEGVLNLFCPEKLILKKLKYDNFSEGTVIVSNGVGDEEKKFGVEDSEGNELVPIVYDYISQYQNGVAIVAYGKMKGILNKQNNFIQSPIFDSILRCDNGYFIIKLKNKYGLLKADGSILLRPIYSKIESLTGCFRVENKSIYNYLNLNGKFEKDEWEQDVYDETYTQRELDDMYRDAFDGFADAMWNVD